MKNVSSLIKRFRALTDKEETAIGVESYGQRVLCIELLDGTIIVALRDAEGNGFGQLSLTDNSGDWVDIY